MDINEIMAQLPHRYPFLLVDRVTSFEPHKSLTAYKNVTFNEPFFQGHFPGRPVMPGVLIVEAMAQAGGLLAYLSKGQEAAGQITYVASLDKVRFRRPVVPGDRLDLRVELLRPGSRFWKVRGEAFVGEAKAAEAEMVAALGGK
ncbi:MAG: 3-hydroxyacyl-ACP dehydratase FabZ [Thermodesulfobacteriota bacterium]